MIVDCEGCTEHGTGCGDCVVTVLLGMPGLAEVPGPVELDEDEARALDVLARSGLVPPLRLRRRGDGVAATG